MIKHSIENVFYKLNLEYLNVLKKSKEMLKDYIDTKIVIDGIVSFWCRKRKKAEHIISFFGNKKGSTLLFTGVSTMDVESGEAIPFLMSGKRFIYDDPICLRIQLLSSPHINLENHRKELDYEICDEIKLIENYGKYIAVLPIRYYYHPKEDEMRKYVETMFLDLFDGKFKTIKEYYENNLELADVEQNINKNKIKTIKLSGDEDPDDSLEIKTNKFDISLLRKNVFSFSERFFLAVFSVLSQSFGIVYSSFACELTPYLRNPVCMLNTILFWRQYINTPYEKNVLEIVKKCVYSYGLYKVFDCKSFIEEKGLKIDEKMISSYFNYFDGCDDSQDISGISPLEAVKTASTFCIEKNLKQHK